MPLSLLDRKMAREISCFVPLLRKEFSCGVHDEGQVVSGV